MIWMMKHRLMTIEQGADEQGAGGTPPVNTLLGEGENTVNDAAWLPEKFQIKGDDGQLNIEDSARKLAENYAHLEKRLGSGDAPPKSMEEYAPQVEVKGFQWEEFKQAPESQEFLKGAHAKGITNDQMGFILGEYLKNAQTLTTGMAALDADAAAASLRDVWKNDAEFSQNLGLAHRAFTQLAEQGDDINSIGNNPLVIRLLAKVGREMQEDSPAGLTQPMAEQQTVKDLMRSPAYMDDKHPDHQRVSAQVRAYYQKHYGDQAVI
nr:hypothetical protein [Rosenbergiella australiborealis]